MLCQRGMTVIPVFWIRILLTPLKIFICDQIRSRSLLARLMGRRSENWILTAHPESNPKHRRSAATKGNRNSPCRN